MDEEPSQHPGRERVLEAVSARSLSTKQLAFVVEYVAGGFNATKAAKAAGYSERTADRQGSRLLKNVEISDAIRDAMKAAGVRAEVLMDRLMEIAVEADLVDFAGFLSGKETLLQLRARGVNTKLIKSVTVTKRKDGSAFRRIELHDSLTAARELLKHVEPAEMGQATAQDQFPKIEMGGECYRRILFEELTKPTVPGLEPIGIPKMMRKQLAQEIDQQRADQLVEDLHAGRLDEPEEQEPEQQSGLPSVTVETVAVEPPNRPSAPLPGSGEVKTERRSAISDLEAQETGDEEISEEWPW